MQHTRETAIMIEKTLKERGYQVSTKDHEKINWDAENQRYLPSTYTYTVSVRVADHQTGNTEMEAVLSIDDIDGAMARAKGRLAPRIKRTRQAIAAERRIS